jgi:beta-lactam-binding protein with PASTA domain
VPSSGTPPAAGTTTEPPAAKPTVPKCVVPRLAGLTLARAKKSLAKAHCGVGRVTRRAAKATNRAPKPKTGTVVAQSPKPGTRKRAGARVAITLAR